MKTWQVGTLAIAGLLAAGGAVSVSLATAPRAAGPVIVAAATVVAANPGWAPAGSGAAPSGPLPLAPALPPASGPVLFSSDFSTADATAWQSPPLRPSDSPALWLTRDGTLQQAGDTNLNNVDAEAYYLTGPATWHDIVFEAAVLATSGEGAGVVWDVQGESFYRLQLLPALPNSAPKALLERVDQNRVTVLAAAPAAAYAGYTPTAWQQIRVQSSAGHQQVWVNASPLFAVSDGTLTHGQVGLYAWADSGTHFDNVRVQSAASTR